MSRKQATPIKNLSIVVNNIVRDAIRPSPMSKDFHFGQVLNQWVSIEPVQGHKFGQRVVSNLYEVLTDKLKDKIYDKVELWSLLVNRGVNPVDAILPNVSATSIWWTGLQSAVPALVCETSNNPRMPAFDVQAVMASVIEMDAVFERLLQLDPVVYKKPESQDFMGAKARLFAALLTSDHVLVQAAFSPLVQSCFDAWIDESKSMNDERKMAGISYVLNRFERMTGYNQWTQCPIDFHEHCRAFFNKAVSRLSEIKLGANVHNDLGIDGVENYKYIHHYLSLTPKERSEVAQAIALIGNTPLLCGAMFSLIKHPSLYAKTLSACGVSDEVAHTILSQNLGDDVYSSVEYYRDIARAEVLVQHLCEGFKAEGFSSPIGSVALDGLTVSLDLGEHFERKGYLRREGRTVKASTFAHSVITGGAETDKPTSPAVIQRKVDLAVKLGQRELLIDSFDAFFKGNRVPNRDLGNSVALKHVLESGGLLPSDILSTELRIRKAAEAGVSPALLAKGLKLTQRVKGELLGDALGF
jgi:hypothetical protein